MEATDSDQSALPVVTLPNCKWIAGWALHLPHPSHIKMLRFLKKVRKPKPSKTPVPPENATRQITSTGAEYGRDAEGERRSRQISTYKADGTDSTMTPDTGHEEGSRIANQDERIENQQLPALDALTLTPAHGGGDASECDLS